MKRIIYNGEAFEGDPCSKEHFYAAMNSINGILLVRDYLIDTPTHQDPGRVYHLEGVTVDYIEKSYAMRRMVQAEITLFGEENLVDKIKSIIAEAVER